MWRAIWNGPFYIGPLSRPVSVGDVQLKVLETLWRAGIVAALALAAALLWLWMDARADQRASKAAMRTTEVTAKYDVARCDEVRPIHVIVGNRGDRTLTWVGYEIEILEGTHGRNIAPTRLRNLFVSEDLSPGEGMSYCHSVADYSGAAMQLRPEMLIRGKLTAVSVR